MKPDIKFKIIRLKNNSISEKYAAECIIQAAKFGITVEYFDAINGLNYQIEDGLLTNLQVMLVHQFQIKQ
jgi:hypothetical protein